MVALLLHRDAVPPCRREHRTATSPRVALPLLAALPHRLVSRCHCSPRCHTALFACRAAAPTPVPRCHTAFFGMPHCHTTCAVLPHCLVLVLACRAAVTPPVPRCRLAITSSTMRRAAVSPPVPRCRCMPPRPIPRCRTRSCAALPSRF